MLQCNIMVIDDRLAGPARSPVATGGHRLPVESAMQNARQQSNTSVEPRGQLASRTLAMPADTNPLGDMFGGWIMSLMDAAAFMTATEHAKGPAVTVAVSNITFMEPIKAGDAVCCYTDVERVGQTSITLHVDVWVLRQGQGDRVRVTAAEFVFVAVNDNGRPRSVSSGSLSAIPATESPRVPLHS
jgi:acyl-CoA thioesterase YciA